MNFISLLIVISFYVKWIICYNVNDDSCHIQQISETKGLEFDINVAMKHCLYLNINSLGNNDEGIVTFNIKSKIKLRMNAWYANAVYNVDNPKKEEIYPTSSVESIFPIEQAYESWYEPKLREVYHLYFKRETILSQTSNDYLLIYIEYINSTEQNKYDLHTIKILPLSILDKSHTSHLESITDNKSDFMFVSHTLTPYKPFYANLFFSGEYNNNYLLTSQSGYITYTCDTLLYKHKETESYSINLNRQSVYFTDINMLNIEGRMCHKVILKYLVHEDTSFTGRFTVNHLNIPFRPVQVISGSQSRRQSSHMVVEINNYEDEYHLLNYLGGKYNDGEDYYMIIHNYYGNMKLSYIKDKKPSFINTQSHKINANKLALYNNNQVIKLNKEDYNFFYLKCKEKCLNDIITFRAFNLGSNKNSNKLTFELYGDYYIVFDTTTQDTISLYFDDLASFSIVFELIGTDSYLSEIHGTFQSQSFTLNEHIRKFNSSVYVIDEFDFGYETGTLSVNMNSKQYCVIRINIDGIYNRNNVDIEMNTHQELKSNSYHNINTNFYFKFPKDRNVNTFQIQLFIKDEYQDKKSIPIQFISAFHKRNENDIISPSIRNYDTKLLSYPSFKYIFEISNPYLFSNEMNTDMVYYVVIHLLYINYMKIFIAFTGIITPYYPLLKLNTLNLIEPLHKENQQYSYLLERGGKVRDSKFILEFYKCEPNKEENIIFNVKDYFNRTLWQDSITSNSLKHTFIDIGVDYSLHLEYINTKVLMFYQYVPSYLMKSITKMEYSSKEIHYYEKQNIINIKPFLIDGINVTYELYITTMNNDDINNDLCIFYKKQPYTSITLSDISGEDINITLFPPLKQGNYLINIIAFHPKSIPSFSIYQPIYLKISSFISILSLFKLQLYLLIPSTSYLTFLYIYQPHNSKSIPKHI